MKTVPDQTIVQGQDGAIRMRPLVSGMLLDPAAWRIHGQARTHEHGALVIDWDTAKGTASIAADGTVRLTWTAAQTQSWCHDVLVYDAFAYPLNGGSPIGLVQGSLVIDHSVTQEV